jgi:erythromycin esterase-like protein
MAETLEALAAHLESRGGVAKIVVWEHNSHLGDARATEIGEAGEFNVGQLVRERYAGESVLVGFTTYHGTVTAASNWDAPAERKRVRPALPGSYEALFHEVASPRFMLDLRHGDLAESLCESRLERAIGSFTVRKPNGKATTSMRGWPINSMPCCILTKRELSRLSSASRPQAAKSRRHSRRASERSASCRAGTSRAKIG